MKKEIGPATHGNPPIQPPSPSPHLRTAIVTPAMSGGISMILVKSRSDNDLMRQNEAQIYI
jgi:hypothetical protein